MSSPVPLRASEAFVAHVERAATKIGLRPEELLASAVEAQEPRPFLARWFGRMTGETPLERQMKLEMQHAERLRALEMGRALPEIERLRLDTQRRLSTDRAGSIFFFILALAIVPVAIAGISVGASGVVFSQSAPEDQRLHLVVVWVAAAFIAFAAEIALAFFGMLALRPHLSARPADDFELEASTRVPGKL